MTDQRSSQWSHEEVAKLLAAGASERIAFLPSRLSAAKLAETLVAMANAHGGMIIAGVTPGGRVAGIEDPDEMRDTVQSAEFMPNPAMVLPLPQIIDHYSKQLCLVEVPPGLPQVYSLDGRYLTRSGSQNRLLTSSELGSLLLARGQTSFEALPTPNATPDDLDPAQIASYLEVLGSLAGRDWQRALLARGCLTLSEQGATPTYAGILLFGRQPQRFVRGAEIIMVRYNGTEMSDEFLRQNASGTLSEQIIQAQGFINANMRRGARLTGLTRQEVSEYPMAVVREAIVNAVAHRDYSQRGESIRVLMFSDHLEVYSPGRLPGHVTLDNLVSERYSRNEVIVQVLSDIGYVERLGYGIDRMISAMREAGLPEPLFDESVTGFRVSLQGRGNELVSIEPMQRWGNLRLTPRQERALAYLVESGSITNRAFRELFPDLSDETIRRELADLVDQGLIMKVGDRKATYYILK